MALVIEARLVCDRCKKVFELRPFTYAEKASASDVSLIRYRASSHQWCRLRPLPSAPLRDFCPECAAERAALKAATKAATKKSHRS